LEAELKKYFDRLWPICRSITGDGLRESLKIISELAPMEITEVPTGTKVLDWTIPEEWNIEDAWIETPSGERICEFKKNNLHVLNYSIPVDKSLSFEELEPHLHSIPSMPDAIPYLTSYYKDNWGFCLDHRSKEKLSREGTYRAVIKSRKEAGSLSYGEAVLKGESDREILFSTYLCHPSMAINELSGPLVTAFLYKELAKLPRRKYSYRFLFAPETIGVIAYLEKEGKHLMEKLDAGYVITCVGHEGKFTYKRSKRKNSLADRAAEHVLKHSPFEVESMNFKIGGSDERQYCSPGFNLPVGSVMRTMYKEYPEYHTSLDNEEILSYKGLRETVEMYVEIAQCLELNEKYKNTIAYGEPQLGKRGLYPSTNELEQDKEHLYKLLHFLAYADGEHDLIEIAEEYGTVATAFEEVIIKCREKDLV
jgi:aminopeptidase-like protein